MPKNVSDKEEKIKSSSVNFMQALEVILAQRNISKLGTSDFFDSDIQQIRGLNMKAIQIKAGY